MTSPSAILSRGTPAVTEWKLQETLTQQWLRRGIEIGGVPHLLGA